MSLSSVPCSTSSASSSNPLTTRSPVENPSTASQQAIPIDIILAVFRFLPPRTLGTTCSLVCKSWKAAAERNVFWQDLAVRLQMRKIPLEEEGPDSLAQFFDRPIEAFFPLFRRIYTASHAFVKETLQAKPFCQLPGESAMPLEEQTLELDSSDECPMLSPELSAELNNTIRNHVMGELGLIPPKSLKMFIESPLFRSAPVHASDLLRHLAQRNPLDAVGERMMMDAMIEIRKSAQNDLPDHPQNPMDHLQQTWSAYSSAIKNCEELYKKGDFTAFHEALLEISNNHDQYTGKTLSLVLCLCLNNNDRDNFIRFLKLLNPDNPELVLKDLIDEELEHAYLTIEYFKLLYLNYPTECIARIEENVAQGKFGGLNRLRNCFVFANEDAIFFDILVKLKPSPSVIDCLKSLQTACNVKGNNALEAKVTQYLGKFTKEEKAEAEAKRRQAFVEDKLANMKI